MYVRIAGTIQSSVGSALILDTMPAKRATRILKWPRRSLSARLERAYVQAAKGLGSAGMPKKRPLQRTCAEDSADERILPHGPFALSGEDWRQRILKARH